MAGILFMLLYRMPEGLLAKVSALFLIDAGHNGGLGLSPQEYGLVQGTVGVVGLTQEKFKKKLLRGSWLPFLC